MSIVLNFFTTIVAANLLQWYALVSGISLLAFLVRITIRKKIVGFEKFVVLFISFVLIGTSAGIVLPNPQLLTPALPLFDPIAISEKEPLTLIFDRPISKKMRATIVPDIQGEWKLTTTGFALPFNTLSFIPKEELTPDTEYLIEITDIAPLTSIRLFGSDRILFAFKTRETYNLQPITHNVSPSLPPSALLPSEVTAAEPTTIPTPTPQSFILNVPQYKQHYTFTCFSIAAKMALGYRGVEVDEIGFLHEIGFDQTPRNQLANIWGDPNKLVVGTYNGSGDGGYGVHWDPVATTINKYRKTEVKHNWDIPGLLKTVQDGNPVMVWWVNGVWPAKDVSWNLPDGQKVYTVNGMHVEVVVGWKGNRDNPDYILTNDPWRGRRQYKPEQFLKLWKWFGNTGVIVY